MEKAEIVITGCGLNGMISALALAAHNFEVTIIEKRAISDQGFISDGRTTALNSRAKNFFEQIGLWQDLEPHTSPIKDIYVVDNKSDDMLHFDSQKAVTQGFMGYMIENHILRKTLLQQVSNHKLIKIIDNNSYEVIENNLDNVTLKLDDGRVINAQMLLACDTRKSPIIAQFFTKKLEKQYNQYALTFNVSHQKDHEYTAIEHFFPTGPFAILPLKDQKHSSIVWTIPAHLKDSLLNMEEAELEYNVQDKFGPFLGDIKLASKISCFPLSAYIANSLFLNHIVLLGDTAHVIHPLAGQGLNQSIQDIQVLAQKLLIYGICKQAVEAYAADRMSDNMRMFYITDGINKVFSNNSSILSKFRNIAFRVIESTPRLKHLFILYAMGRR